MPVLKPTPEPAAEPWLVKMDMPAPDPVTVTITHAEAERCLAAALEACPALTPNGLEHWRARCAPSALRAETREAYEARIAAERQNFNLPAVAISFMFCGRLEKAQGICWDVASYGLKHALEDVTGHYIANGEMIAGAIAAGFRYEQLNDGPNAFFDMRKSQLRHLLTLAGEARQMRR